MRHRHGLRKLNRTSAHRLAMLRNMMNSLLRHEAIKTTLPKAKELRRVIEPMITLGKEPTVANKRLAFARLRDREMVTKLFNEIGPRFANRNGGYTRILKMGFRVGDNAPMAYMELVEKAAPVVEEATEVKAEEKATHEGIGAMIQAAGFYEVAYDLIPGEEILQKRNVMVSKIVDYYMQQANLAETSNDWNAALYNYEQVLHWDNQNLVAMDKAQQMRQYISQEE